MNAPPLGPVRCSLRRQLADQSAKTRLPTIYTSRDHVEEGGLIAYGASRHRIFRRAAEYADLPVQQPTTFELVINQNAAKALGLMVPHPVLLSADEVIQ